MEPGGAPAGGERWGGRRDRSVSGTPARGGFSAGPGEKRRRQDGCWLEGSTEQQGGRGAPGDGREAGRERVHRHQPASTLEPPQVQAVGHGEALCLALLIRGMGQHLLGRVLAKEGKCCF